MQHVVCICKKRFAYFLYFCLLTCLLLLLLCFFVWCFLLWKQSKLVVNDQGLMLALILFLHCRKCSTCSWGLYRIFHYPHSFWSGKSFMFPFFLPNCKALGMQCILMITKNTENHNFKFFFSWNFSSLFIEYLNFQIPFLERYGTKITKLWQEISTYF